MILIIATVGQIFCGTAGLTSASRTWYAFSRDRGMPGWALFRRVNRDRVPFNAVIAVSVLLGDPRDPGLFGKNNIPFAFFALTGICTVGLYLAYIIPVYLRLRAGDSFQPGPWNLGSSYRSINILAIIFVVLVVFALDLPYTPTGLPWNDGFDTSVVNYTPLAILLPLIFGVWYLGVGQEPVPGSGARRSRRRVRRCHAPTGQPVTLDELEEGGRRTARSTPCC